MYVARACYGVCMSQRTIYGTRFSPSTIWDLGTECRSSGLMATAFNCCTISLAPINLYIQKKEKEKEKGKRKGGWLVWPLL